MENEDLKKANIFVVFRAPQKAVADNDYSNGLPLSIYFHELCQSLFPKFFTIFFLRRSQLMIDYLHLRNN